MLAHTVQKMLASSAGELHFLLFSHIFFGFTNLLKGQCHEIFAAFLLSYRAGIFKKSMGARNRGGIGLSYRPARLHRLAEFIPWNQFRGSINI